MLPNKWYMCCHLFTAEYECWNEKQTLLQNRDMHSNTDANTDTKPKINARELLCRPRPLHR